MAVASDSTGQGVNSGAVARADGAGSATCGAGGATAGLGLRRRRLNGCAQRLHHRGQHRDGRALCRHRYRPVARRPRQRAQARCRSGRAAARRRRRSAPDRVPRPVPSRRAAGDLDHRIDAVLEFIQHRGGVLGIGHGLGPGDGLRHFAKRRPQARHRRPFVADHGLDPAERRQNKRCVGADVAPARLTLARLTWSRCVGARWPLLVRCERVSPICTIDRSEANRSMAAAPQFSTDRFALKLGLFYAAYFFFGGVQLPFFPLWLEARGLDARTIGIVIAVPTLMRIVATPIITHAADRHRALKATLAIGSVVGLARHDRGRAGGWPGRDSRGVHRGDGGAVADAVAVGCLCAVGAGRARPELRPGAAVGLGRLHRRQCRRRASSWRRSRPAI